jgi:hypothetical protein
MPPTDDRWSADSLRLELLALNRSHLTTSHHPHLRGCETWPNQQPDRFAEELADAQRHGVRPLAPGEAEFDALMKSGERFNWAVRLDGTLRVVPSVVVTEDGPTRISHAILADNGGDVLAAGEGRAGGFLSKTTGHYKNLEYVLEPVRRAFENIGISFKR